jgi:hypothetical protein
MTLGSTLTGFADWRKHLAEHERRCPWPGPRPFEREDRELLAGRDVQKDQFLQEVASHRLIFLTGPSGVGKSSLLEGGLIPLLEEDSGFLVVKLTRWGAGDPSDGAVALLAQLIHHELSARQEPLELPEGPDLFWELADRFGERAVIILDQFEELLRYSPAVRDEMFELLLQLNHETRLKFVVSFRDEYVLQLRPLERGAQPFSISHVVLEEVAPEFALDVILAANREADRKGDPHPITPDAAKLIAKRWEEARRQRIGSDEDVAAITDPFARIGLLHLQALLYALHADAPDGVIDRDVMRAFRQKTGAGDDPRALFLSGLKRSVDVKLERCVAASRGIDPFLVEGTRHVVARSVEHLSSAGFKLVREVRDLARTSLFDELDSLGGALARAGAQAGDGEGADGPVIEQQVEALFGAMTDAIYPGPEGPPFDLLQADRATIADIVDARVHDASSPSWRQRLHPGAPQDVADPADASCGPMSGLAPAAVLIEELRRFAFALAWLHETTLVRLGRPPGSGVMVSLIHDGFGSALIEWSIKRLEGPGPALHAITAPRGASFPWQFDDDPEPQWKALNGADEPRFLVNLRWRGGWARATFRRVVFANCDLRGMFFDHCRFTGVTFLNCLMDGVIFSDCVFEGEIPPAVPSDLPEEPTFAIPLPPQQLATIAHYRDTDAARTLISQVPGAPAVPAADAAGTSPWVDEQGGIVVYGCRISSMVLRSCRGPLSLRYAAGSGFDVVERSSGRYEVFASTLRHVAFSQAAGADHLDDRLDVAARDSILAQVWFGTGLDGTFEARDSVVVQLWNEPDGVEGRIAHCSYYQVEGVEIDAATCADLGGIDAIYASESPREFAAKARLMTYRRNPALHSAQARTANDGWPRS